MKTFLGDMHEYIFESQSYSNRIIENRKEIAKGFIDALGDNTKKLFLTGAGTSNYSPKATRAFIEKVTGIPTFVVLGTSITNGEYIIDDTCVVGGISATGTSKNTIEAIEYAKAHGAKGIAFTNDLNSPYGNLNEYKVFVDHGVEDCSPKSKSYVCEMVTLFVCAIEYGLAKKKISEAEYNDYIERLTKTCNNLNNIATKSDEWYFAHSREFTKCERMILVGYGANKGTIEEGALKILECGRFQTSFYELEEFMHGIYHSIHDDVFLLYFANTDEKYFERALQLRKVLSELTTHQFVICKDTNGFHDDRSLDIDFVDDKDFNVIEYIIPAHIISYNIAKDKGINCNYPSDKFFHKKMNSKFI